MASKNINAEKIQGNFEGLQSINVTGLTSTTSATTYDDIVVATNGDIMINKQFNINIFFEVTGVTYNFISPYDFQINQLTGTTPSSAITVYNTTLSATTNIGDTINQFDQLTIDTTITGLTIFNSQQL